MCSHRCACRRRAFFPCEDNDFRFFILRQTNGPYDGCCCCCCWCVHVRVSVCIPSIQHASHKNQHTLLKAATTIHRTATTIHNSTQALSGSKSRQTIHSLAMAQRQPFKQYLGRANFRIHLKVFLDKNDNKLKISNLFSLKQTKLPFDLNTFSKKS